MNRVLVLTSLVALVAFAGSAFAMDHIRAKMIEKAKKEGEFVVAGSNAAEFRDRLKGFRKAYPWLKVKAFDANTSATVNRVVTEAKAGKLTIDMVGVDESGTESLAQKGLLKGYDYPHMKDMIGNTQPRHGQYVDAFMNPRVQGIYNTDLVKPQDVPRNWDDMTSAKYKGLVLLSRSAEEFPSRMAWLWGSTDNLNWEKSFDFFTKMVKNQKPAIGRGYAGGTKRVAAGDVGIFWFPALGTYSKLKAKGAPVEMIAFPKFPMTFRSFAIMKDAPNPAGSWAAHRLPDVAGGPVRVHRRGERQGGGQQERQVRQAGQDSGGRRRHREERGAGGAGHRGQDLHTRGAEEVRGLLLQAPGDQVAFPIPRAV